MYAGTMTVREALERSLVELSEVDKSLEIREHDLPGEMAGMLYRVPDRDIIAINRGLEDNLAHWVVTAASLLSLYAKLPVALPCLDLQQVGSVAAIYLPG